MQADEIIRRSTINRVMSEHAIRRSKSLVKMAGRVMEREKNAPKLQVEGPGRDSRPLEVVREDARRLRELSREALEKSKAARDRHIAFRDQFSVTKPATKPPKSKAA